MKTTKLGMLHLLIALWSVAGVSHMVNAFSVPNISRKRHQQRATNTQGSTRLTPLAMVANHVPLDSSFDPFSIGNLDPSASWTCYSEPEIVHSYHHDVHSNNAFEILGLDPKYDYSLNKHVIKQVYKGLVQHYHPDAAVAHLDATPHEKKVASDQFARINAAYKLLMMRAEEEEIAQDAMIANQRRWVPLDHDTRTLTDKLVSVKSIFRP